MINKKPATKKNPTFFKKHQIQLTSDCPLIPRYSRKSRYRRGRACQSPIYRVTSGRAHWPPGQPRFGACGTLLPHAEAASRASPLCANLSHYFLLLLSISVCINHLTRNTRKARKERKERTKNTKHTKSTKRTKRTNQMK